MELVVPELLGQSGRPGPGHAQQDDLIFFLLPAPEIRQQQLQAVFVGTDRRRFQGNAFSALQRCGNTLHIAAERRERQEAPRLQPRQHTVCGINETASLLSGSGICLSPGREALGELLLHRLAPLLQAIRLVQHEEAVFREMVQEAHLLRPGQAFPCREDLRCLQASQRALGFHVKSTEIVHLRVPEFHPHRVFHAEGENVGDAAANGEFPHGLHLGHPFIAEPLQLGRERRHFHHGPGRDAEARLLQALPSGDPVHEAVNGGDNGAAFVLQKVPQHLHPLSCQEGTLGVRLIKEKVLRRVVPGVFRQGTQVPLQPLALLLITHDHEPPGKAFFRQGADQQGPGRFRQAGYGCGASLQGPGNRLKFCRIGQRIVHQASLFMLWRFIAAAQPLVRMSMQASPASR